LTACWSDDEFERDGENESTKHVVALTGRVLSGDESLDLVYDELAVSYKSMDDRNTDTCKQLEEHKNITNQLKEENGCLLTKNFELNIEVNQLKSQLNHIIKQVKMMTTGANVLDEILEGQIQGKPNGIGFTFEHSDQNQKFKSVAHALEEYERIKCKKTKPIKNIKFVASTETKNPTINKLMLQHSQEHQMPEVGKASSLKICHLCNRKGHLRPFCNKLYGFQRQVHQKEQKPKASKVKKMWKPKSNIVGFMACSSSRT